MSEEQQTGIMRLVLAAGLGLLAANWLGPLAAQGMGQLVQMVDQHGRAYTPQNPLPVDASVTSPSVAPAAPTVSVITTGGTAVTAFAAGAVSAGGYVVNPSGATQPLCVNISGAAGVSDGAGTSCLVPGQTYTIPPMPNAVSVNATDSGHVFSGQGYQ